MKKSLNELIELLTDLREELAAKHDIPEDVAGEAEVRLAYQPNYPLECRIDEVTALPESEVAVLNRLQREGEARIAYIVYIAAGDDVGYASKSAWEGGVVDRDAEEDDDDR